ncbi:hypothetical protein RHOSPDRAFT_26209 [Rhodotorula sp. JG-1b]|nr:hypothetical protein RHOSPDRAFT_26209 [Rhodotorula sp. JG-1b]
MTTYPLSPPSSTSLPEHWTFPPSASAPPVTDGPNTRARLAVGLEPLSGGTETGPPPLAPPRAAERTDDHQHFSQDTGLQAWADQKVRGKISSQARGRSPSLTDPLCHVRMRQYPSRHATATTTTETYYAIDPTLECYHPQDQPRSQFLEYDRGQGCRRDFSTARFIDRGSPPASPTPSFAPPHVVNTDETLLYATRGHGHGHGGGGFASLGLTKEEWLRLGGFLDGGEGGDLSIQPLLPSFPPDLRENVPAVVRNRSANDDDDDDKGEQVALPIPPPLRLPSPTPDVVAAAAPTPTPTVLGGPLRLPPAHLPASMIPPALPLPAPRALPPPVQFSDAFLEQQQQPALRTPTRSQRRRAPSPIQAVRAAARPAPYPPTVTVPRSGRDGAVADDDHATSDIAVVEAPPPSLLTPIRAALAKYPEIPLPAVPPSPLPPPPGKKKKRHGRKMSADHIPRPRNAFILFRSHAITSGLIPRSIGVKDHKNISQIVGGVWRGLSEVERQQWEELAEEEKRRHLAKYPNYAYRPKQTDKPRAAPGYGKKAKAKAARLAAEYAELTGTDLEEAERYFLAQQQHQHAHVRSGTNNSSTTSGDNNGSSASFLLPPPPLPQDVLHKRREERRMALIAQALLEGEQDDRVLLRVELQLEAEMGPAPAVAAPEPPTSTTTSREEDIPVVGPPTSSRPAALGKKKTAKTTLATPPPPSRRTRSSSARGAANEDETTPTKQQQPPSSLKRAMYASPAGGGSGTDSTQTQLSPSPFRRSAISPASPSSSDSPSPSPSRMQSMPMSRGGGGGSSSSTGRSSRKHPLSRSQSATTPEEMEEADGGDYASDDLPAARRQKTSSYGILGVSSTTAADPTSVYMFPPTRHSGLTTADVPLFAGPTDSRNFSLGRWELQKPSAAVTSRREMLARQVEEQEQEQEEEEKGAWVNSATEATIAPSPFLLNSSEFLFEAGLEPPPPPPPPTRGGATGLVDPRATVLQPPLASSSYACAASATDPHDDDASTEYGTAYSSSSVFDASWQSDVASSSVYYDTAPSSSSAWSARSPTRMTMPPAAEASGSLASKDPYGLFRPHPIWSATSVGPSLFAAQQQHNNNNHGYCAPESGGAGLGYEPLSATATAGGGASPGQEEEDLFHFGAEDLFAQPPPALSLFEHDPSARTISSMFDPTSPGAGIGDERLGLGIAL